MSSDISTFKFGLDGMGQKDDTDELSDDDHGGAEPNESNARSDDDYFSGVLESFEVGC